MGGGGIAIQTKITAAHFARLFRPDSALHWLDLWCWGRVRSHGWDHTDFANWSSVEWRGSHQWSITWWIDVQSFCVWWHGDVAKMRTAPKNAIFTQNFAMSATPVITTTVVTVWILPVLMTLTVINDLYSFVIYYLCSQNIVIVFVYSIFHNMNNHHHVME